MYYRTSWIDVSHRVMKGMLGACLEEMESRMETCQQPSEVMMEVSEEMTESSLAKAEARLEVMETHIRAGIWL